MNHLLFGNCHHNHHHLNLPIVIARLDTGHLKNRTKEQNHHHHHLYSRLYQIVMFLEYQVGIHQLTVQNCPLAKYLTNTACSGKHSSCLKTKYLPNHLRHCLSIVYFQMGNRSIMTLLLQNRHGHYHSSIYK